MTTAPAPFTASTQLEPPYHREGVFTAHLDRFEQDDDHFARDVEERVYAILLAGVKIAEVRVPVSATLARYGHLGSDLDRRCHDLALTQFAGRLAYFLNPSAVPVVTLPEPETPTWPERHPNWVALLIFVWLVGSGLAITYGWPW